MGADLKFLLFKAKRAVIGSIRRRKTGKFQKDRPGHWRMLREIVGKKLDVTGVHPNTGEAKLMHVAARNLTRHMASKTGPFNRTVAQKFLDENYSHLNYRRFGTWKNLTIGAVEKYINDTRALHEGKSPAGRTKSFDSVKNWRIKLENGTESATDDLSRDAWVAAEFAKARKPIAPVLFAAREILEGRPLSMVQSNGFAGFCKSIIDKCYDLGPSEISGEELGRWKKAFRTLANRKRKSVTLPMALMRHISDDPFWKKNPRWYTYCAQRMALKNDGMVDLVGMTRYIKNAMRKHGGGKPPRVDYDQFDESVKAKIRLGMIQLTKKNGRLKKANPVVGYHGDLHPAEITLDEWAEYLDEGGPLCWPHWLSDEKLDEIARQFNLLDSDYFGSK